jgi:putative nucleotidyltransferase with HDIG domain
MWSMWNMPQHIQEHSLLVTQLAVDIAHMAKENLLSNLDVQVVQAAAMLHDLAKYYTILHGGSHSQIGAAWLQEHTGNAVLARAVLHHVHWPFVMDFKRYPVSLIVCYSDKRVKHTEVVSLEERYKDLQQRYGTSAKAQHHIQASLEQGQALENLLSQDLKVNLDAHSFSSRRMVG